MRKETGELADQQLFIGARIGFSYLAVLCASALGGLISLIFDQFMPIILCRGLDDEDALFNCQMASGFTMFGIWLVIAFAILCVPFKLGMWEWPPLAGFIALLVIWGEVLQWYWWAALALIPVVCALLSYRWKDGWVWLVQRIFVTVLSLVPVLWLAWIVFGPTNAG
ncbi:MAG: hypothetical protein LBR21_04445 [Propionibacteriaceae bacterium]|jgi:hypothetical protein|nr:hypothetical protein [Propionibacteriaceae bacterium]